MKIKIIATAVSLLAFFSAGLTSPAHATQPVSKEYTTLVLNQGVPTIDVMRTIAGDSIDPIVIFTAELFNKSGKKAGTIAGFLTDLDSSPTGSETRFRNISFSLKGGQLIANGAGEYKASDLPLPQELPSTIAIIGGTGKYIGARGEVKTSRNADGTFRHVFKLLK